MARTTANHHGKDKKMNSGTRRLSVALLIVLGLASRAQAAQRSTEVQPGSQRHATAQWTLRTDDTELIVSVANDKISVSTLKNPARGWNWAPVPCEVPLPGKDSVSAGRTGDWLSWNYREATEDRSDGYTLTLRFTSAAPSLELKSVWRAYPGPGPVENWVTIENKSGGNVTFDSNIVAARLRIRADETVKVHRAEKTAAGKGKVYYDPLGAKARVATHSGMIPFIMLDAGSAHGMYLGFEWELGGFQVQSASDPLDITASVHPITEKVTRGNHEVFTIPSVYYGTYKGDIDDGSNRFKKWFWNRKITRSLYNHADEPWTEVCMQAVGGRGSTSIVGDTPQSVYDALAATGVELVKMDFWDGTGNGWYTDRDWKYHPQVWPHGFNFAAKAHQAGLKASLYMGGTYRDCDLTTTAGRDAELAAVLTRYDQGWFDVWRTDLYTAPKEPMPQTYDGVANFLDIQDYLIKNRPGYRYENCCNGGKYKGFAICRRMTFCTMNDVDQDANATRSTYYSNSYAINPVQLKSDLGPATTAFDLRTDMLGSILTWAADNAAYRQHLALYKTRQRPILRGADVYHILPMADGVNWDGLEYFNTRIDKGSVFLFKPSAKAMDGDSKAIKLKGLDRKSRYALTFQDRTNLNCTMTGAQLIDTGIAVTGMTGDRASEIIWIDGPAMPAASP
jgi:hypothetical protein